MNDNPAAASPYTQREILVNGLYEASELEHNLMCTYLYAAASLRVRGNLEITSGSGRVVARVTATHLCRCGASANKPFCDGSHANIGFTAGGS